MQTMFNRTVICCDKNEAIWPTYKHRERTDSCQRGGEWGDGPNGERGVGDLGLQLGNE